MLETLLQLPDDPILGLMAAYRKDPNPLKIDLGVGVYKDETGNTPVLEAVKQAQLHHIQTETTKTYIGPPGSPGFGTLIEALILGADHPVITAGRTNTLQTPGGCGALRAGAELIKRCNAGATVWVSNPTWANHIPLMGDTGLQIKEYPYYDRATASIQFEAMIATLEQLGPNDVVLLHGCCHNPCGADLNLEQWQQVAELAKARGFLPLVDLAYQGLGDGLEEDAAGLRILAAAVPEMLITASCSKNFGLYRERTGAIIAISSSPVARDITHSQLCNVVRAIYSMPPAHGAALVEIILSSQELTALWNSELTAMRNRINDLRRLLVEKIEARGIQQDFSFITRQKGMFSFLGVSPEQVRQLKADNSIYFVESSRINVAGINAGNIDYLVDSLAKVL
ncbi:aromatic amino acid transaminase [Aestuariirhabdus litorea]|uniref:Aspartate/tyrosine/aromatic aminotransferase n=1 Tax=Aestuariirhabdus litorea TaxID=2528527 RepID=A0A3P3VJ90_9GAMM|nr:amino acid aminotransferase [Aestuariirhabdus litorea]RRJ82752.1 aspartate/tyrosine/aromatic aminotransferase [Aestuariirhabdus litorea]RWW92913.1 aminotransferase class I/II-fold pyridoxal phosphate-dependent enzyme [Endozoicomonadaceae bacterium GTF-13]